MISNLSTNRTILRELVENDWEQIHQYASQLVVCQFQPWGPNTESDTKEFVQGILVDSKQINRTRFVFAIIEKESNELIGSIEFNIRDEKNKIGEVGYIVHPKYWGMGFASEVGKEIISFGFKNFKLHRLYATCDVRNIASQRVLEKCGLTLEGRMREDLLLRDGWRDTYLFSILEDEWLRGQ
ncbi:GNAT family N-acetyltransferase [Bacillus sp. AFS041924]|uniref:GNAT family N-acetyltransferase n=1 Tax=Bacillus sp. AFS041924 TaxID=2033503 RepID=UPI000BFC0C7D|nr:GNAT family protein [Bacillus sp. AFS041924]PGS56146.1 GNAT family N-acetyltransferase [Bacillus sp. AFS041924]